ncbi:MAG: hypothetical protein ACR2NB_07830 [Solirubrobacteraceae bacterium]
MLFDLRGRGRRNTIKIVYVALALLMGVGLVGFGIGGNTSGGGLLDALTGSSGGADTGEKRFAKQIKDAEARLRTNPQDEASARDLVRARVNLAGTGGRYDIQTDTYNADGKAELRRASDAWKRYEALDPKNKDEEASVAKAIARAYGALGDLPNLVATQKLVAANRNAVGPYSELARLAYGAGQTREADIAAKKALELVNPDDREQLKGTFKSYKDQGTAAAAQAQGGAQSPPATAVTVVPAPSTAPKGPRPPKPKAGSGSKKPGDASKGKN